MQKQALAADLTTRVTSDWIRVFLRVGSYLSSAHTDDAIHIARGIIKEGHSDGMFAGRQPIAFGGRVDLEDMSSGTEDGLLPLKQKTRNPKYVSDCSFGVTLIYKHHYALH